MLYKYIDYKNTRSKARWTRLFESARSAIAYASVVQFLEHIVLEGT